MDDMFYTFLHFAKMKAQISYKGTFGSKTCPVVARPYPVPAQMQAGLMHYLRGIIGGGISL